MIACGLAGAIGDVVAISKWNTLAERAKLNTMSVLPVHIILSYSHYVAFR
jgi:hypothetical protein